MATAKSASGYDRVLSNLITIKNALKSNPGARENLTLHYIQHKWLGATENPVEVELVRIALVRIEQDPSQFDTLVEMLRETEGMDLIVRALVDVAPSSTPLPSTSLPHHIPPTKRDQSCLSPPSSSPLPSSSTSESSSVATKSPDLSHYGDYLRAVYSTCPVAKSDKFPPTPSKKFIKLAIVKKKKVSQAQADKFTRLTLQGDIDQILQVKEPIEMDDILRADGKTRLVVVEGAPGIGKSTLAWELCRKWPTLESMKQFSLVVLLRLRENGVQSATNISDLFYHHDIVLSRHVGQEVERKEGDSVLFVFDGFDEFPAELREKSLVMDIISGSKYLPKATVLVTSRPSASAQLQALLQTGIGKHIEVVGFSEKEILEFAQSVFNDTNLFTDFTAYLTANPVVKGMMYNPLNSAIVVGVYQDTYELGRPVPHTQTQLYTELTLCLLFRYTARKLPDKLQDLPHDSDIYQQLVKVGELAFNGKLKNEVIFKELPGGCSDLGLLVQHTDMYTRKETTTYNFFHLTLQEYMSAFYISQLPADEQRTLFRQHSTSMDVVWRFVAGLTKMKNIGWHEFKRVKVVEEEYEYKSVKVEKEYEYYVGWNTVFVGPFLLQCLYEAQDVQTCESVLSKHRVEFKHDRSVYKNRQLSNYGLYALGYCVSQCSNTWSVAISDISREGLEMLGHGIKDYSGGSIEKLNLAECRGILNEKGQIPPQILQHINSFTLNHCDIDQIGFENLAECIPSLHSLTSLDISCNRGGDGNLVKLLQALKKHGKLQTLYMDHISIGMDDVAALADLIQPSSSLKELSLGEAQSRLSQDKHKTDIFMQLVTTVLSPSSPNKVTIHGYRRLLCGIETKAISVNISVLSFKAPHITCPPDQRHLSTRNVCTCEVKYGTKLGHVLRKNTSLKELSLHIELDKDELCDIIDSLKDNHTLDRLDLLEQCHSWYFSTSERRALDNRIKFS